MSSTQLDTKERILKTTWDLMEKNRGKGVRLEDIAQGAGVSRQAVYMHFGSRSGLLTATARYLDKTMRHAERTEQVLQSKDGIQALDALVVFWASYIPDIYGLAKALMTVRETDEDAASAWNDRMTAFYDKCQLIVRWLANDAVLSPEWTVDDATSFMWSLLSISNWEHLTMERGWSNGQYVEKMQTVLKKTLVKSG